MRAQVTHNASRGLKLSKFVEDQTQPRLNLFIRVEHDLAGAVVGQATWQRYAKLAPRRLLPLPLMQADADLVQLRFTHDPREP